MFNIPNPHEIIAELHGELQEYQENGDGLVLGVKVMEMIASITGCFVVRLLRDIPVGKEHGMIDGRELWAWNERMLTGESAVWVMGDGLPVKLQSREYEVVR